MVTHLALTGSPAVGKTTLVCQASTSIRKGIKCFGFITEEKRDQSGQRCGFDLRCIESNATSSLATVHGNSFQPRVGKYFVDVQNVDLLSRQLEKRITEEKVNLA